MNLGTLGLLIGLAFLGAATLSAEPTAERSWKSTAGTEIKATALSLEAESVQFKTGEGRLLTVPLGKLAADDQAFLRKHFGMKESAPAPAEKKAGPAAGSGVPLLEGGLALSQGEKHGPIAVKGGSHYFAYLPKSLRQDRPAPLLFVTRAGGGKVNVLQDYVEPAERLGWIIAVSQESKNGSGFPDQNHAHAKRCVEHLTETLPVDEDRLYFTGGSGGGAMSWMNCAELRGAGAMPVVGYIPGSAPKSGHFYTIGGATDYNRYLTAAAAEKYKKDALHRFYPGGHGGCPKGHYADGMAWLEGRFLGEHETDYAEHRLDYEAAMLKWIGKLQGSAPHKAYYWADFLLGKDYEVSGENRRTLEELHRELGSAEMNVRYAAGLAELDEFSAKEFASHGSGGGSLMNHSTSGIKRASKRMAEKYAGVPEIEGVAKMLGEPTVGTGKKK